MKQRMTFLAAVLAIALGTAPTSSAITDLHFALSKSMPEADSSIQSPTAVKLWFTEAPELSTVSIRLVNGGGDLVAAGDVEQDEQDAKSFSIALEFALATGPYTVSWRAIGEDGHAVRGDFTFAVTAQ